MEHPAAGVGLAVIITVLQERPAGGAADPVGPHVVSGGGDLPTLLQPGYHLAGKGERGLF